MHWTSLLVSLQRAKKLDIVPIQASCNDCRSEIERKRDTEGSTVREELHEMGTDWGLKWPKGPRTFMLLYLKMHNSCHCL